MHIIKEGYASLFIKEPEPDEFKNNASAHKHSDDVTPEFFFGRIRKVSTEEVYAINRLTVADNGNKLRLILDCRYTNQHLQIPKLNARISEPSGIYFKKMHIF